MNQKQYRKYLNSPEWKARREPVLERDNHSCTIERIKPYQQQLRFSV